MTAENHLMLTPGLLILFILLAIVAEILGTLGGFGSSLFFVPLAGYFFDFHSVLGITAFFHVSSNLAKIGLFRAGFDKQLVLSMGIPAVVCVIAGALLSSYVNSRILEILLGCFLVILSVLLLTFKRLVIRATTTNAVVSGTFSGMLAGLLGTGGAIRGITLAAFDLKMEVFIATSAIIDLAIDISRSVVYTANGYVHRHDLYLVPILLAVSLIGTFTGKKILMHISQQQFKGMVLLLILGTGMLTLIRQIV